MTIVGTVKATALHPGMKISRIDQRKPENANTVSKYTGECEKGIHFGTVCYDRIASYNLWR